MLGKKVVVAYPATNYDKRFNRLKKGIVVDEVVSKVLDKKGIDYHRYKVKFNDNNWCMFKGSELLEIVK